MNTFSAYSAILVSLFASQACLASNPCGESAGTYTDDSSTGTVERTVSRFKQGNHFVYAYSLNLNGNMPRNPAPYDGESYAIHISLNGKSATSHGHMSCTTVDVDVITDGKC